MPNLRKNSTVLTYNDDAIYKAMENQRKTKKPGKLLSSVKHPRVMDKQDDNIPDVVYAQDGRQFFPCLYCCHAFAIKTDQLSHMQQCNFKTVSRVPDPLPKPALNKTPNIKTKRVERMPNVLTSREVEHVIVKPEINFYDTSQDSPNEIVQKSQNIDSLMQNKALTVIKKVPTKIGFPKIKFKFPQKIQNIKFKSGVQQDDTNHETAESAAAGSKQSPPKLTFPKEELKYYHDMYRKSDMSKCTICFKAVGKGCWYRHLRTHCSEKKYSCGACDKKFGRKDHRDLHEKTHANHFLNNS
ncbi:hypothetical protein ILUMI_20902 [Ignelater luminosus]|uniref:C2H2-type domain-containing protein n=1 Tax=Ignelater luminosus TaxID=2038154 RepID=A0A8K0CDH3_IGNLU|nr:hypothetical protein ILUMI_20902 [Ignelater luminosus]